jgi:trimeric autotransporter adhesin
MEGGIMADLRASGLGGVPKGATADRPSSPSVGDVFYNGTLGYQEIYSPFGWFPLNPIAPAAPTSVVGTNVGTSRAYNDGAVSVAFDANSTGGVPASFNVTASTGQTGSAATSPIVLTGIASAATPTFTVTSTNNYGTSSASSASSAVTVTTVPQAPSVSAAGGNELATITLTGATGGSAITSWSITSSPATTTQTATSSPYTFTGLTNETAYTFTATATNTNGTSTASAASNSVTASNYQPISFDILMVAGGGSGGNGGGGGGGAGGLLYSPTQTLFNNRSYTVTVGAGGTGATSETLGNKGIDSVILGNEFNTLTAEGGGGGGAGTSPAYSNAVDTQINGGSGGGSKRDANNISTLRGLANGSQGNNGGLSTASGYVSASGGGGAGGVGGSSGGPGGGIDSTAGSRAGGIGLNTYSSWASATSSGSSGYYAGGGGGSSYGYPGAGGLGGGGVGSNYYPGQQTNATSGQANTGGGGGGISNGDAVPGGSGIVILRYTGSITASTTTGSPNRYETGGYTYYKFNNTGSITF